jgi:hypothetical protein
MLGETAREEILRRAGAGSRHDRRWRRRAAFSSVTAITSR